MGGFEQLTPRFTDECSLHQIIHHLEMTGNVRLKRELVQDRFTESMDGLDFKPAWRLQRACEQPSRRCKAGIVRSAAFQRFETFGQLFVGQDGPFGKPHEHAVLHHRRCRLGIGEAENLRRVRAF